MVLQRPHLLAYLEPLEPRRLLAADLLLDAAGISAAQSLTIGNITYFFADNGTVGRELWKSDGTARGTTLVKDLTPGPASTDLVSFFHAGDRAVIITVVLGATAIDNVYSLWSSDGTADGTVKLADFTSPADTLTTRQVGEQIAIVTYRPSAPGRRRQLRRAALFHRRNPRWNPARQSVSCHRRR